MVQHALISGANGFVGRRLSTALVQEGWSVCGLVRSPASLPAGVRPWMLASNDFANVGAQWPSAYRCDTVVHLAARVHMMREGRAGDLADVYRETNVAGSLRLARAARDAGARRFVFVSSIKALAESDPGRPLRETDTPHPSDAYGVSKLEAEHALLGFGRESGLEIVIARPPLVYGPGVRANFLSLMKTVDAGWPLPLGAVTAKRSLVYVDNLVSALAICATHPRAAGQTFHVTDPRDLSVAGLVRALAVSLQTRERMLSVPVPLLRLVGALSGRRAQIERLTGSLRVDSTRINEVLGWLPPYTVEQGLAETAAWFHSHR